MRLSAAREGQASSGEGELWMRSHDSIHVGLKRMGVPGAIVSSPGEMVARGNLRYFFILTGREAGREGGGGGRRLEPNHKQG